jgi:hypothetical protein
MPNCRACNAEIRFELTAKGRLQPISIATGGSHFADCPQADRFKKPPIPENQCGACGSEHVEREPGTGKHYAGLRCLDCNAHRWLRWPQETKA